MEIAGSAAKLMACAILNDCMICPVRENEAAALSNFSLVLHFSTEKK